LDHAPADVARIEKVSGFAVWYEDTEDTRESPVVSLWHLHLENIGGDPSEDVEHSQSHDKAP